ncbi:MAG: hypothetical protein IJQ90_01095 [Alphaproteobacteria bacterium]|nr:hypothetical protein [Alphaproteobacteria bacterium]
MIRRFFVAFAVGFVCIFGATAARACTDDEIDVLGDGTQCETVKFTVTTTELAADATFQFYMSAKGTFYVDCGGDGILSSSTTDVSGKTITRSNTTGATYTCTYSTASGPDGYDIRFGGIAGTAANKPYSTATTAAASVIRFNVTPTLVARVSGSLGAIFPTRNATYTPRFRDTFSGCTNLTEIPSTLFSGVTGAATSRFYRTFYGCTSLQSIPAGLFDGINAQQTNMFYQTFYNCSGLTGYIPAGLFDKITSYASNMMYQIFYGTGLDTSCSGTTVQYTTIFDGYWNGRVSCVEPYITEIVLNDADATTASNPTTVYLKYGTGWYSDSNATTPISALSTNPTKTGYIFDGYWTVANGSGTQVIDANGGVITTDAILHLEKYGTASPQTVYANWVNNYTVTYSCGDGTGTPPANETATSRKTFNTPTTVNCSRDGYAFSGWLVSGTSDVKTTAFAWNYTEDKTFTAQWGDVKFSVTTTNLSANTTFRFILSVNGTVYIDWGDGTNQVIVRTNTTDTLYEHTYQSAGKYTMGFGAGRPTAYGAVEHAPIRFNSGLGSNVYSEDSRLTSSLIAGISGSLGALFPTIGASGVSNNPSFYRVFRKCVNLEGSIPPNLFAGATRTEQSMFAETFKGCTKLSGQIPAELFASAVGAPERTIFYETFMDCPNLWGEIPEELFATISGAPVYGIFENTFMRCTGLSGTIPENLFSGIVGAPAQYMFSGTFQGTTNLTGYVPRNLFSGITSGTTTNMMTNVFTDSGVWTECPCGTNQYITGFESWWSDRVSCQVGKKSNEHWNNGVCTTDCELGFTTLKTSNNLEYPILTDATGQHNINIGVGGDVCRVPLASGAASNAINVSFGGAIYHATVPDEIVPDGFTGQPE